MSLIRKPHELDVQPFTKTLIYGQPGLRKTTFALSAPSPLLLDFDNGIHRVDPRHQSDTVQIKTWEDVQSVLQEDLSAYKTLVIDTAGKMLDYMTAYLINKDPKLGKNDGSLTLQGYGARKVMFQSFLKSVMLMGKHLVFVAHEREEKEGEQKVIRPEIGGSSASDLIKELDLVGYMQSIGQKKTISFEPCEKFYGKNTCKLPPRIDLNNTLEDNKPNNQLATIIDSYQSYLDERKTVAAEYGDLIDLITSNADNVTDIESLNSFVAWAQTINHIWDSKLQAGLMAKEKSKIVGATYDAAAKQYKPAGAATSKATTQPAKDAESATTATASDTMVKEDAPGVGKDAPAPPPAAPPAAPAPAPPSKPSAPVCEVRDEQWFTDRIGKKIFAKSEKAYNGEMKIEDAHHATHLFAVAQKDQGYTFGDVPGRAARVKKEETNAA
jgi:hypothetical protein